MSISYVRLDPNGNITGLILSPLPTGLRRKAAEAVFRAEPDMEQLGFLSLPEGELPLLRMSGGEFCGNASLSAAAWLLRSSGRDKGRVELRVSGAKEPVAAELERRGERLWLGTVEMPLPLSAARVSLPDGDGERELALVSFPGISHLITEQPLSREKAEELIRPWCALLGAEALGLMLLDRESMSLRPLVWVPGAGTLCWERSCASGSCAVGAWLALSRGESLSLSLSQPGGRLSVEAEYSGARLRSLRMSGQVICDDAKTLELI